MFKFVLSQYFMILAVLISFPLLFKSLFVLNNSLKAFQKAFALSPELLSKNFQGLVILFNYQGSLCRSHSDSIN